MPAPDHAARHDRADDSSPRADAPPFALVPRAGEPFHGGVVVRVFLPRRVEGYSPTYLSASLSRMLDATAPLLPRLVVLPAGTGRVEPVELSDGEWTDDAREATRASIARWSAACATGLPDDHPPVVVGVDGAATWEGDLLSDKAVQVAVVLAGRQLAHVTAKTKPRQGGEAGVLDLAWDDEADRPAPDALVRHRPVAEVDGDPTLLLVCFDAAAWSQRSRAASAPDGCAGVIAAQYDALLAAPGAPRFAVNLLHRLPRKPDARSVTSPVFQNAHRVLRTERNVRVVSVAGLHPRCAPRAFAAMHADLACDFASVDVFVAP